MDDPKIDNSDSGYDRHALAFPRTSLGCAAGMGAFERLLAAAEDYRYWVIYFQATDRRERKKQMAFAADFMQVEPDDLEALLEATGELHDWKKTYEIKGVEWRRNVDEGG